MKSSNEEILNAFKLLKQNLAVRDYDDELFVKDIPETEPISLVIPFERSDRGYLDIFRSYIGGDKTPELSDEEALLNYLNQKDKKEAIFSDPFAYSTQFFKGCIEENESRGGQIIHEEKIHQNILQAYPEFDTLSRFEQRPILTKYYNEYWDNYTPKTTLNENEQKKLVSILNAAGLNACSEKDKEAADTSSFVVLSNGIITPFMEKKWISKRLSKIKECMLQCGMRVGGHVAPISIEQIRTPQTQHDEKKEEKINLYFSLLNDLKENNISDVKEQVCSDKNSLFRGGLLGEKAFTANIDISANTPHCLRKSYAMATKNAEYAIRYANSGCVLNLSDVNTTHSYGFLYEYSRSGNETYFPDRGIERAPSTAILPVGEEIETAVFPHKNKLKHIYLVSHEIKGDKTTTSIFPLSLNNPLHKKFLELHNPVDTRIKGHLKERNLKQLEEANKNKGMPYVYGKTENEEKITQLKKRLGIVEKKTVSIPLSLIKQNQNG